MKNIYEILYHYWGYTTFRPLQKEIITAVLEGKDTLALLPTGAGKSLCFQVPALAKEGICLVISPLIALMKDQVKQLRKKKISCQSIHSGLSTREIDIILDNCIYGDIKLLYLSPERLKTKIFIERAKQMNVNLLAVDEAHCISQWGYDFRSSYLQIKEFREYIPQTSCIALTATATTQVRKDIIDKLHFKDEQIFIDSFNRKNLSYSVRDTQDKEEKLIEILQKIKGSSIVYTRTRKKAKLLSDLIQKNNISVDYYHAGLSNIVRDRKQKNWTLGYTRVIVTTNAFGMGINKANVRLVIHADLPENPESYYQESGRGGRDNKLAYAVILYQKFDEEQTIEKIKSSYPDISTIRKVYQSLANSFSLAVGSGKMTFFDFDFENFIEVYNLNQLEAFYSIKRLEEQGFILLNQAYYSPSKLYIQVAREELYRFQVSHSNLDPFIKTLLRMYGGELFCNPMKISEKNIAKNLDTDTRRIISKLQLLQQLGIIIYEQQKDIPQLTFLQGRLPIQSLKLDDRSFQDRKKSDLEKAYTMINYATNTQQCRMSILLAYFGETLSKDCGICDNCIKKKKAKKVDKNYSDNILKILSEKSLTIQQLEELIKPQEQEIFLKNIRQLLDFEEIKYNQFNLLVLSKKYFQTK